MSDLAGQKAKAYTNRATFSCELRRSAEAPLAKTLRYEDRDPQEGRYARTLSAGHAVRFNMIIRS